MQMFWEDFSFKLGLIDPDSYCIVIVTVWSIVKSVLGLVCFQTSRRGDLVIRFSYLIVFVKLVTSVL